MTLKGDADGLELLAKAEDGSWHQLRKIFAVAPLPPAGTDRSRRHGSFHLLKDEGGGVNELDIDNLEVKDST